MSFSSSFGNSADSRSASYKIPVPFEQLLSIEKWRCNLLFRTVYGPELIAIYSYLAQTNVAVSRQTLHEAFMPAHNDRERSASAQNIDDALAFLAATGLVYENGNFFGVSFTSNFSPNLLILRQMNLLARHEIEAKHQLDPLYMEILEEVFIRPNHLFVDKIHIEVNKLRQVKAVGGLSQEKVQAWKRVMAFLGVGKRVGSGFQCVYTPALLRTILLSWPEKSASLQSFFETHLAEFLPFETESKNVAHAVSEPLRYLAMRGEITLESRQDSPSRAYFGDQRFQYITHTGGMA